MSSVLFLCLGNICRSPLAQGIFEARAARAGISMACDSAGTGGWHAGEPPDPRAIAAAQRAGYDIAHQRARQIERGDFVRFDFIRAMDSSNLSDVRLMRPYGSTADIARLMDRDVPDPYYGSDADFDSVVRLLESGIDAFIAARMKDAA